MKLEDFHSPTWKRLSQHLNERIEELRKLNDGNHLPEKTAHIRGGIYALKQILDLAATASSSPAVDPDELGADQVMHGQQWPTEIPPP